jgi:hypothetical protein
VHTAISTDRKWRADIVAVSKPPLGTIDAELRVTRDGEQLLRKVLFGGRDAVQDVSIEIRSLEIDETSVVVNTRGTYGPRQIKVLLEK